MERRFENFTTEQLETKLKLLQGVQENTANDMAAIQAELEYRKVGSLLNKNHTDA